MEASWSGSVTEDELLPKLFVLDYTEYADTFSEFIKKYPNFTLDAYSEAKSESTFGIEIRHGKPIQSTYDFIFEDNGYYEEFFQIYISKFLSYTVEDENMANSPTSIENQIDSFLEQFKRSGTKVMDDTVRGNYNVNSNISRSRSDNLDLEVLEADHQNTYLHLCIGKSRAIQYFHTPQTILFHLF
ncbi:hypothetical protein PV328_005778 [Microctonus aethiopoides]|uniref:Uncharacterized protein n=1 Tax=Microctonus aethiopoides TaxID=144406 RepID=A0AA39KSU6_9HYME|nr:hypothetical protein PV328_005778 [Microctonus aethiopoides]